MRVLGACSLGGAGHLGPLRVVLDAARRRGDEVAVVAPTTMAEMVRRAGHTWLGGSEPPEAEVAPIREQLPVVDAATASVLGNRELFGRLATAAMLPEVRRVVDAWRPDLVLRDPCEYASAVVAAERGLPVAQVAISRADVEWGSLDVAGPALEHHLPGLTDAARSTPYLTRFPPSLDPDRFPTTARLRPLPVPSARPTGRRGGDDRPLVHATFGTVLGHMSTAVDSLRVLSAAVAGLDARVLLTTGPEVDPIELGPLPSNVVAERWVELADALAEASLVVCHGGSGTVLGSLAAGRPVVVVPLFADQFANAAMVAAAGVGVAVERGGAGGRRPLGSEDVDGIRAGAAAVLEDRAFHRAAGEVAAEMSSAPLAEDVLDMWSG